MAANLVEYMRILHPCGCACMVCTFIPLYCSCFSQSPYWRQCHSNNIKLVKLATLIESWPTYLVNYHSSNIKLAKLSYHIDI